MSPPPFPVNNDASPTTGSPSLSLSPSLSSPSSTTSSGSDSSSTPASTTLLFGFLVIFVALFAAFLFLGFFWQYQRLRRRRAADLDEGRGADRKTVPKMWEVWIQDEFSGDRDPRSWESIRPLSVDVGHGPSSGQAAAPTLTRSRRWPRNLFRHQPVPPAPPQPQPPNNSTGAEGQALSMYGSMRMSFVIAMPHTDAPNRRRSEISQVSRAEIWRGREYAIGMYHPPFWERAPL
ncbi:hypothetical protein BC827DRAFT_1270852 [Russula dissimulans]|nr:hypothetical protein BC827DRAFT_1270852 [Russula dissimulans]